MNKLSKSEVAQKITEEVLKTTSLSRKELIGIHPDNLSGTTSGSQWVGETKNSLLETIIFELVEEIILDNLYDNGDLPET